MIRMIVTICAGVFCLGFSAQSQDISLLAKSLPGLESTLALHVGSANSFSGRLELSIAPADGGPAFVMPAFVYYADECLRCDVDPGVVVKRSGGKMEKADPVIFLFNSKSNTLFVAEPSKKAYREVKMAESAMEMFAKDKKETRLLLTQVGSETVGGQSSSKSKGVTKRGSQEVGQTTVWRGQGGSNLVPLKIETAETNRVTTLTFRDVRMGSVGAEKFLVPRDFRKVSQEFSQ